MRRIVEEIICDVCMGAVDPESPKVLRIPMPDGDDIVTHGFKSREVNERSSCAEIVVNKLCRAIGIAGEDSLQKVVRE